MGRKMQASQLQPKRPKRDEKITNVDEVMALRRSLLHASQDLLPFNGNTRDVAAVCRELTALLRFFHRQNRIARDLQSNAALIEDEIETALEVGNAYLEGVAEDIAALAKDISIRLVDWHYRPSTLPQVKALTTELQQAGLAHLLYTRYQRAIRLLSAVEKNHCLNQYARWIDFVWDHAEVVPLLADGTICTGHGLAIWLRKHVPKLPVGGKQKVPDSETA